MPIDKKILEQLKANDASLVELDLSYHELSINDLQELVAALADNHHLTILNVSGNPVGDPGIQLLTNALLNITTLLARDCKITSLKKFPDISALRHLDLANNKIGVSSAVIIANSRLQSLSLAGCHCTDEVAIALAKSTTLISLTLSHNKLGIIAAQSLASNTSIKTLVLNYNDIQTEGITALANNTVLSSLSVVGNNITEEGILALAYQNTTLTILDVSYNFVKDASFAALATHPGLLELNVGYNQITFRGAQDFVAKNSKVETLIICHNLLGNAGASALFKHTSLLRLDMAGNGIGFSGAYASLTNKKTTSLTLSTNLVGDSGAMLLAQNTTLIELYLSYNAVGDKAAEVFADNHTLKVLNLNYNEITEKGRHLLRSNKNIPNLVLSEEQPPEFTSENLTAMFLLNESFQCICDLNGTLQFFNPAFSRVLGYSSDELLAKSTLDFLHPEDKAAQLLRNNDASPIHSYENRYLCKDGSYRIFQWNSYVKLHRIYKVGRDITEYRLIEQTARLAQQINDKILLQESLDHVEKQTRFISHTSHEIRNPASGIKGLLDISMQLITDLETVIAQSSTTTSPRYKSKLQAIVMELKDNLTSMMICVDYQLLILNTNLSIVKISDKNFQLEHRVFDLKTILIDEVVPMLRAKAIMKGITIKVVTPEPKELWVKGDALRLKQIIMNLLGNAIKFTEKGGIELSLLILETTAESIQVQINVKDSGIGLTSIEQSRLFGRFVQGNHETESHYGGSGLGLHLARELALAMNGDITIVSEIGKGSTFSATVKFAVLSKQEKIALEEKDEAKNEFFHLAVPSGAFGVFAVTPLIKRKILVVDDNKINRRLLSRILVAAGHSVIEAEDGEKAVETFKKNKLDLILMDIQMPVKDGIEATKDIRALEEKREIKARVPIFAITANALENEQKVGLDAGMDRYFSKPVDKLELLTAIDKLNIILPEMEIKIGRSNTAPSMQASLTL